MAHQLLGLEKVTNALLMAGRDVYPEKLRTALGWYLVRSIKRKMGNGTKPLSGLTQQNRRGKGGNQLQDSGRLRQSIQHDLTPSGVEVGTNVIYGPIHQTGGFIRPKNAQKLAIPATPTVARWTEALGVRGAIDAFRRNFGPISFGPGAIFCRGEVMYWRLDEVRIPRRQYLYIDKTRQKKVEEIIENFLRKLWY